MYSGTTFRKDSGRIVGVHQKIDRAARRHLKHVMRHGAFFPGIKDILHFEGMNGPDGIKRKSPSKDEPWHYINPRKPEDKALVRLIQDHSHNLTVALKEKNEVRASFEAAWMAHAIVDGLTPAHHYPLNDKIEELWGKPHHERTTIKDKNIIRGSSRRDTLAKNWEYWGKGGVFTAHIMFEWGVASAISPLKFEKIGLTDHVVSRARKQTLEELFLEAVHDIAELKMYEEFGEDGWTRHLVNLTKKTLIPRIIRTVCLAWLFALEAAEEKA
ncbi:MAG: hypothetical protein JWN33_372 [Candidatus Saccharibacteria bacterium]|nr:hypothetical protein [Candidatus Saccharibacteria bacterium]